jgi:tRNA pseudouridine55 synthase
MYSAVSVNGRRLYALARKGVEGERTARPVTVHSLTLLSVDEESQRARFEVRCSKGTYVRTLFFDIGQVLGCGAALAALRRTAACGYSIDGCITLDEAGHLAREGALEARVMPVWTAFAAPPRLETGEWQAKMLSNGVRLQLDKLGNPPPGRYSVWSEGRFLGLGTWRAAAAKSVSGCFNTNIHQMVEDLCGSFCVNLRCRPWRASARLRPPPCLAQKSLANLFAPLMGY